MNDAVREHPTDAGATPYARMHTLLVFAETHAQTGNTTARAAALSEMYALCKHLCAEAVVEEAEKPSPPNGLTAREAEVLRHIAGGMTIKQVATLLCLSPRTVERHITTIYRKIDARGRAGAAAYALRHGLLPAA
jgi:DNA-binding NarL/FixJ family response regulator